MGGVITTYYNADQSYWAIFSPFTKDLWLTLLAITVLFGLLFLVCITLAIIIIVGSGLGLSLLKCSSPLSTHSLYMSYYGINILAGATLRSRRRHHSSLIATSLQGTTSTTLTLLCCTQQCRMHAYRSVLCTLLYSAVDSSVDDGFHLRYLMPCIIACTMCM